jgi:hypothetical protein
MLTRCNKTSQKLFLQMKGQYVKSGFDFVIYCRDGKNECGILGRDVELGCSACSEINEREVREQELTSFTNNGLYSLYWYGTFPLCTILSWRFGLGLGLGQFDY